MVPGEPLLAAPRPLLVQREPRGSPAGDGVTTADDMVRLGRALLGDTLLRPATKARLFPARPGEPWRIGQSGGSIGINTDLAIFPQSGLISVVLSNFDPPAGDLMGFVLRKAALGEGCTPLREEDRPSPMMRRLPPPPQGQPGGPPRGA